MYYGDLAGNGSVEMVEAFFDHKRGRIVPWRDLDAVAKPLPWVRERFPTSQAYGEASLEEILGQRLKVCKEVRVNWLDTTIFLNRGDHFEIKALPLEAQFAPAFGVCVGDLDGACRIDPKLDRANTAVPAEGLPRCRGRRARQRLVLVRGR